MKTITVVIIAHLFLLVTGNESSRESKRVGCWYYGGKSERYGLQYPEDMGTSLCSHFVYLNGVIEEETEKILIKDNGDDGLVTRLVELKAKNADMKLILLIGEPYLNWILKNSSRRANIIENGVKWLKDSGFDGLNIPFISDTPDSESAEFFCDFKTELDKFGFILTTMLADDLLPSQEQRESLTKLARCCEYITLANTAETVTVDRAASLNKTKSSADILIERGVPAEKIQITAGGGGMIYTLEDGNRTEVGANASGPGNDDLELGAGFIIHNKELKKKFNDTSLGWTFRRDDVTKEPYAFTTTGLWVSYEDAISAEFKAVYVLEKGLGGIDIVSMELEEEEGVAGDGRFALTRRVYDIFRRGNHSVGDI